MDDHLTTMNSCLEEEQLNEIGEVHEFIEVPSSVRQEHPEEDDDIKLLPE